MQYLCVKKVINLHHTFLDVLKQETIKFLVPFEMAIKSLFMHPTHVIVKLENFNEFFFIFRGNKFEELWGLKIIQGCIFMI